MTNEERAQLVQFIQAQMVHRAQIRRIWCRDSVIILWPGHERMIIPYN